MTKEQIEKNADNFLEEHNYTSGHIGYFAAGYCRTAHIAGAESRQPEIDKACKLLEKLKYRIPHLPEWDADYEDEERLRREVEQFLKEQGK